MQPNGLHPNEYGPYTFTDTTSNVWTTTPDDTGGYTSYLMNSENYVAIQNVNGVIMSDTITSVDMLYYVQNGDGSGYSTEYATTTRDTVINDVETVSPEDLGLSGSANVNTTTTYTDNTVMQRLSNWAAAGASHTTYYFDDSGSIHVTGNEDGGGTFDDGSMSGDDSIQANGDNLYGWDLSTTSSLDYDDAWRQGLPGGNYLLIQTTSSEYMGSEVFQESESGSDASDPGRPSSTDSSSDGDSYSDNYDEKSVSQQTETATLGTSPFDQQHVISSWSASDLIANGKNAKDMSDRGTDAGDGSSDDFDDEDELQNEWSVDQSQYTTDDGLGTRTSGGSVDNKESSEEDFDETGDDAGPISDTFEVDEIYSNMATQQGSWSETTTPDGTVTKSGSVTFQDETLQEDNESDVGNVQGTSFDESDYDTERSFVQQIAYNDGSETFTEFDRGESGQTLDVGAGANASASASGVDLTESQHWWTKESGSFAVDGSETVSISAGDGGSETDKETENAGETDGGENDAESESESAWETFYDRVTGTFSIDTQGNVTGSDTFKSGDKGGESENITATGAGAFGDAEGDFETDSYSLTGSSNDTFSYEDSGVQSFGPSEVTGSDTAIVEVTINDTANGTDTEVVTPAGGAPDTITITLSASDEETFNETLKTVLASDGSTSITAVGTVSGSDDSSVVDSDATDTFNDEDRDTYSVSVVDTGDPSTSTETDSETSDPSESGTIPPDLLLIMSVQPGGDVPASLSFSNGVQVANAVSAPNDWDPFFAGFVGAIKGTVQGALNTANGVTDIVVGIADLPARVYNNTAGYLGGGTIGYLSNFESADWSRGFITDEDPTLHAASKFIGGFAITTPVVVSRVSSLARGLVSAWEAKIPWSYARLPYLQLGKTDRFGNILIRNGVTGKDLAETVRHEGIHRFFSPKSGWFLQARGNLKAWSYENIHLIKYIEEAAAETVATGNLFKGLAFPFERNYVHPIIVGVQGTIYSVTVGGAIYSIYDSLFND